MQQLIYCGLVGIGIFIGIGLTVLAMKVTGCYMDDYDYDDDEEDD
jgi:hypothetical protein